MRLLPCGDSGLLVELADLDEVLALYAELVEDLPVGVLDLVHRLVAIRVEALAERLDAGDAVPLQHVEQLALGQLAVGVERGLARAMQLLDHAGGHARMQHRLAGVRAALEGRLDGLAQGLRIVHVVHPPILPRRFFFFY